MTNRVSLDFHRVYGGRGGGGLFVGLSCTTFETFLAH